MCPIPTECGLSQLLWYRHYPRGSCCDLWPEYRWMNVCVMCKIIKSRQTKVMPIKIENQIRTGSASSALSSLQQQVSDIKIQNFLSLIFEIFLLCLGRGAPNFKRVLMDNFNEDFNVVSFKLFEPWIFLMQRVNVFISEWNAKGIDKSCLNINHKSGYFP